MLKNKWYLVKVVPKKFHLNGHDRILSIFDTWKLEMQDSIVHSGSKSVISGIYFWILGRDSGSVIGLLAPSYLLAYEEQGIHYFPNCFG